VYLKNHNINIYIYNIYMHSLSLKTDLVFRHIVKVL